MKELEKFVESNDVNGVRGTTIFDSGNPGPNVGLMCLTHGNERNPARVVLAVMENLRNLTRGRVILSLNNLPAFEQDKRFLDEDMNRIFRPEGILGNSSEAVRARELTQVFDQMDIALDLHSVRSTRDSKSFTVIPGGTDSQIEMAKRMDVPYQVIYPQFINGTGSTSDYFVPRGKSCITLETGDDLLPDISRTVANVKRYLAYAGVIDESYSELFKDGAKWMRASQMEFTSDPRQLKYADNFPTKTFTPVEAGMLVATQGDKEYRVNEDGFLLFARNPGEYSDRNLNYFEREPFLYLTEEVKQP